MMYQTCHFGYEWHTHICCSSIMPSKGGGGGLIQTAEENRDRQVPDPDWIGNLDNPSSITGVLP